MNPKYLIHDFNFEGVALISFANLNGKEKRLVRRWRNDGKIRRWSYSRHLISAKEHGDFLKKIKDNRRNFYWLLKGPEKRYLGVISLNKVDLENRNAYLGIYSNPGMKGAGYLLMKCLKEIAFVKAKLHTLKLEVIEDNSKAIAFYKKHGFKVEGRLNEFVIKDGKRLDALVMGIIDKSGRRPLKRG